VGGGAEPAQQRALRAAVRQAHVVDHAVLVQVHVQRAVGQVQRAQRAAWVWSGVEGRWEGGGGQCVCGGGGGVGQGYTPAAQHQTALQFILGGGVVQGEGP
jgi:hypothetical protein